MNQSTAMAERLGVNLHADARDTDTTVNYGDRSIPGVWNGTRVVADGTVNYQAVRHGGGILEGTAPVEFGPTRDDMVWARRYRTVGGTVLTLAERNYLASRSNGVDTIVEDLMHDTYTEDSAPGTVKGTSVRHVLAMTVQQRQVERANLKVAEFNHEHGTHLIDTYNVSLSGATRNYKSTDRDHTAYVVSRRQSAERTLTIARAVKDATVKCDGHPDGAAPKDETCGTCKKCKGREYTAASRARAAERERIAAERKMATIGGGTEWQ